MGLQLGRGVTLGYKLTSGGSTYLPIPTATSIELNITLGEVESTVLASIWKPYLPTIPEGEGTVTVRYDPSDAACIEFLTLASTPQIIYFLLTFTGATTPATLAWPGFVKGFPLSGIENESLAEVAVPFRVTAAPVSTAATP